MISLQDKVVLVTGASSGIGWETALAMARKGARVVAVARNAAKLQELGKQWGGEASRHLIFPADVNATGMMHILLSTIEEKYGRLDILIPNAAVGYLSPLQKMKMETLRQVFETNFFSIVQLTQRALPLLQTSHGHVIFVSSVIGRVSIPHYAAYCSSKFALEALAEALRPELRALKVAVSVVCPALTETNFSENSFREEPPHAKWRKPMRAAKVAKHIVRIAQTRRREHIISLSGKFFLFLHHTFPRFLDCLFQRTLVLK